MIFSFPVFTPETKESSHISNNNEPQNEEYSQDYQDQNNLSMGMNGQPIKKY